MTLILGVTVQAAISEAGGSASVRLLDSTKTTLSGGHPVIRPQMSRAVACWSQSTEQQLKLQSSYEKKTQTTTRDFLMFAQSAFFSFVINPAIKCGPVVVSFKQPVISVVNKRHEVLFSSCIMCDNLRDHGQRYFQLPTYCTALHKKSFIMRALYNFV